MKGAFILLLVIGMAFAYRYEMDYQQCEGNMSDCDFEPCQYSRCSRMGMTCRNNFCGGCHARWYDNEGNYCHECSSYFMQWNNNWNGNGNGNGNWNNNDWNNDDWN